MKTTRALVVFAGAILATASGWSQAVQNIIVTRTENMVQTGPSTVTTASGTPFSLQVALEGDGTATLTSPITGATATLPDSSTRNLVFNSGSGKWRYDSGSYSDATTLANAGFGDGTYNVTLTGSLSGSTNISLTSIASSQLLAPVMGITSTGGSWNSGVFNFVVGQDLNITFSNISVGGGGDTGNYHYDFSLNGTNTSHTEEAEPNDFVNAGEAPQPNGQPTFTVSTSSFVAGQTYTIEVGYGDIQSLNPDAFGDSSNYLAAGLFEYRTTITLQAVPEPSTYATILGLVALAGVMLHRRRQQLMA